MNKQGFSLFEVTIGLSIFMILLGVTIFGLRMANCPRRALEAASRTLQADLQYAQNRAMHEARRVGLEINRMQNRYTIVLWGPRTEVITRHLGSVSILYPNLYMPTYLPRGTVGGPALNSPTLSGANTITLESGRYRQNITIRPVTGYAAIQPVVRTITIQ